MPYCPSPSSRPVSVLKNSALLLVTVLVAVRSVTDPNLSVIAMQSTALRCAARAVIAMALNSAALAMALNSAADPITVVGRWVSESVWSFSSRNKRTVNVADQMKKPRKCW